MSKINFLDVNDSFNTNRTIKNIENPLEDIDFSETIKNQSFHSNSKILHTHLLNSLNYQSQNNLFPSTLPKEINIKFTNTSFIDKFKSLFSKNELAEVNLNSNTIYISSDLLSNNPKDQFLQEFSHKFQDKQSLIDVFFYHEFAHIVFSNMFKNVFNVYSKLHNNYPEINKKEFSNVPLYQVLRNLEENFSDSFSAFTHI